MQNNSLSSTGKLYQNRRRKWRAQCKSLTAATDRAAHVIQKTANLTYHSSYLFVHFSPDGAEFFWQVHYRRRVNRTAFNDYFIAFDDGHRADNGDNRGGQF